MSDSSGASASRLLEALLKKHLATVALHGQERSWISTPLVGLRNFIYVAQQFSSHNALAVLGPRQHKLLERRMCTVAPPVEAPLTRLR
jgi:hypothetical protein